jgi:hypothetical protein
LASGCWLIVKRKHTLIDANVGIYSPDNPTPEELNIFVDSTMEQLPVKLDRALFFETLDAFVRNHQQLSREVPSRKRQRTACAIGNE